ncbi:GDP-mannose 4,6-dehydratase [bacterium]|nr:GDP-mannose 4,6-dehydratase [candidate division CSSED10-310 bacterium]
MMRVLITGIAGFAGSYLAESLLADGATVAGIDLPTARTDNLAAVIDHVILHRVAAGDGESFAAAVSDSRPEWIFHLAGMSDVGKSWEDRERTLHANLFGAITLLESVRRCGFRPTIVVAGSGEEYGLVPRDRQPITETEHLQPRSPYAVSKACQELLCHQYALADGLDIKLLRLFNHIGPRQRPSFVTADFARQVARIERGLAAPVIKVGNLKAIRDFMHVKDMARAYQLAAAHCRTATPYNVSSGAGHSIENLLTKLLEKATLHIDIEVEQSRFRPIDIECLVGANTAFCEATGWSPATDIDGTLEEILNYWRKAVTNEPEVT